MTAFYVIVLVVLFILAIIDLLFMYFFMRFYRQMYDDFVYINRNDINSNKDNVDLSDKD